MWGTRATVKFCWDWTVSGGPYGWMLAVSTYLRLAVLLVLPRFLTLPGTRNLRSPTWGARVNLNLGPGLTITSSGRLNRWYTIAELGLTVNL